MIDREGVVAFVDKKATLTLALRWLLSLNWSIPVIESDSKDLIQQRYFEYVIFLHLQLQKHLEFQQ